MAVEGSGYAVLYTSPKLGCHCCQRRHPDLEANLCSLPSFDTWKWACCAMPVPRQGLKLHAKMNALHGTACRSAAPALARRPSSQTLAPELVPSTPPCRRAADRFHIPATEVQSILDDQQITRAQLLHCLVTPSSALARPPISNFHVGAVGITPAGDIYIGVNVEFPCAPLSNSIHAEQFLIANLRQHGEAALQMVAVNAAPCGHCRQFFSELACADTVKFLFPAPAAHGSERHPKEHTLEELLPQRFRPEDLLGANPPPLLLRPQRARLAFTAAARSTLQRRATDAIFAAAAHTALDEACESYAPYSRCPAGIAVITDSGGVYSGAYLESAAFNPSLPALQVALVDAVIHHIRDYTAVVEVVVAELPGRHVEHAPGARFLLSSIAPKAVVTELAVELLDAAAAP